MRVLVLGGTSFVGRAVVDDLIERGHEPSLFNRGQSHPELFGQLPKLAGDRESGDYSALSNGEWDAVVDVSAYVPRHVRQAGEAVAGRYGRYLLISTGSVYDFSKGADRIDEAFPRLPAEWDTETITNETYGPLKVACEDVVNDRDGERGTIVRPGIVAGPYDPTDRFTYWVRRAARGGRVALAGRPEQPVQVVDSTDLARLVTRLLEDDRSGTYNAVGPADPTTMAGLVQTCAAAAGATVQLVALDPAVLEEPLPLVLSQPGYDAIFTRSAAAARAAGMPGTPLEETAAAVLAWDRDRGEPPLMVGLSAEREAELLNSAD